MQHTIKHIKISEMNETALDNERWLIVLNRDADHDGVFVFAVKTTGIYCRPSCPARRAKRENVEFFNLNHDAEKAGYRACLRCKPNELSLKQRHTQAIETACRLMETSDKAPTLEELAITAGMSPFHFHRLFKECMNMTPKQYAKAQQNRRVRKSLQQEISVTAAIYDAGFDTTSRFYERAERILGMKPSAYQRGGNGQAIWYTFAQSHLGLLLIAGTMKGICAIRFGETQKALFKELQGQFPKASYVKAEKEAVDWVKKTIAFIKYPEGFFELPLDIQGTAFQQKVWDALQNIPYGKTATYSELAEKIGQPAATRAVANACGANPVAVIVPCHRVVRADGELGGYRWDVKRKIQLLKDEGN